MKRTEHQGPLDTKSETVPNVLLLGLKRVSPSADSERVGVPTKKSHISFDPMSQMHMPIDSPSFELGILKGCPMAKASVLVQGHQPYLPKESEKWERRDGQPK